MKKLTAMILALMMACLMGTAVAEGTSLAGVWYLISADAQGMTMTGAMLKAVGMEMTLTLNEDGTGTFAMGAGEETQAVTGNWTATDDGVAFDFGGPQLNFVLAEEKLTLDMAAANMGDEGTLVFSQTQDVAAPAPETVPAESIEQFNGRWAFASANVMGMTLSLEQLGDMGSDASLASAVLVIDNGVVYPEGVEDAEAAEGELVDGKLVLKVEGEIPEEAAQLGLTEGIGFELMPDGNICLQVDFNGMGMTMIFAPAAEAAEEPAA